jgi:hypothetical protein
MLLGGMQLGLGFLAFKAAHWGTEQEQRNALQVPFFLSLLLPSM